MRFFLLFHIRTCDVISKKKIPRKILKTVALITHLDRENTVTVMSQSGKVVGKNQHYYVPATLAIGIEKAHKIQCALENRLTKGK